MREKIYTYFERNHEEVKQSTNGWYTCECPYCGKKDKFAFNSDYKLVKCWRGCIRTMYVPYFIKDYYGVSYLEAIDIIENQNDRIIKIPSRITRATKKDIKLPPGFVPILSSSGNSLGERARRYLKNRGFDLNYLDVLGFGYCNEEAKTNDENFFGYIIIPFYKEGSLKYFIGRDFIGNYKRYKNPPKEKFGVGKSEVIFNEGALKYQDKIYITEGWSDAVSIGDQGVSTQGLSFSPHQISMFIKSDVKEIVIVPDVGAYEAGLLNAKNLIPYKKVKVLNLDEFEALGKDVNSIGWDLIKDKEDDFEFLTMSKWFKEMRQWKETHQFI